jgi:chemotaxis protein MotB
MGWAAIAAIVLVAGGVAVLGCGVSKEQYDAKAKEAEDAKAQVARLQKELAADEAKLADAKGAPAASASGAPAAAPTASAASGGEEAKNESDEAKRAIQEARERGRMLADLQAKFKRLIDAGHLHVTTRHGRVVLVLHNDILFDPGEVDLKPAGKTAVAEVAATLRGVGARRFQVAGHTDSEPITTEKKKLFPTNWELSSARAISVVKLLTSEGVDPAVLSAAGYGPYDPVASNATPDGMAKNRRIEITLVPNVTSLVTAQAGPAASPQH